MARRPDRVTVNFKTERFDKFTTGVLVAMLGRGRLTRKALRDVADTQLIPKVKARTPVETGKLQAGWRIDKEGEDRRGRPYVEVRNEVPYVTFLEFGTLGRRRKKLRKTTERRRQQKSAKGRRTVGAGLSGEGGIRPIRMLGNTMRELRAAKAVKRALADATRKAFKQAKREAEGVRV